MRLLRSFYKNLMVVLSRELDWYVGYVTDRSVDPQYRKGFIAGLKASKDIITKVFDCYVEEP